MAHADSCWLFSIGHSNHSCEVFLELLRLHRIDVLADVRSHPYSKYASQFNAELLRRAAEAAGLEYVCLGRELGGRPQGDQFYDAEGYVLYQRVAQSPSFLDGLEQLLTPVRGGGGDVQAAHGRRRVAMMCSEEDPLGCHRWLLIGPPLARNGIAVGHIRGDGRLQTDAELKAEELKRAGGQRLLFDEEEPAWRSIRSVLPKRQPPSSSES